ncbi:MAG TPA: RES family NAD+ phosphorylase [Chthoniobacterales bacterium]
MIRSPRLPLEQPAFDLLEMPVSEADPQTWVNLRFAEFCDKKHLFYANAGARLTPHSLNIPGVYLARTEKTAFLELYGDRLDAARQAGTQMILAEAELNRRVFAGIRTESLRLCDLARKGGGSKLRLDAGTLRASDLEYPQKFAEAICHHPAEVDGIRYRSRHTDEVCLVVWNRREVARLENTAPAPLRSHLRATDIRSAKLFGEEIWLAGTPQTFDELTQN